MSKLKIIFMGTPDFALPSLQKIIDSPHQLIGVVTQPDKPRGRGQRLIPTPVKKLSRDYNISPIWQPVKLKDPDFLADIASQNADLFVIVAFRILPSELFSMPPQGAINVHPSLLPKYRGAAPIHWTIINGEKETGVTIIRLAREIDAGGILLQEKTTVKEEETVGSLHDRLATFGAELLLKAIDAIAKGTISPRPQLDQLATPAPKITKEMRHISFNQPAERVKNWILGLSPFPSAYTIYHGQVIKLFMARVVDYQNRVAHPGTVVRADQDSLQIACEPGIIKILELQREGKQKMNAGEFLRGQQISVGDSFD